jgi:hypothetical protein
MMDDINKEEEEEYEENNAVINLSRIEEAEIPSSLPAEYIPYESSSSPSPHSTPCPY